LLVGSAALGLIGLPLLSSVPASAKAATVDLPPPGPYDACPVCGMFPARYPDWIATVLFKDGHADHFDGAKDFFKYMLDMKKYAKGRKREEIIGMGVTDYYATERIDARQALYVIGSDVLSPMGHDLIPHPDDYDAKEYMKDHKGHRLMGFDEVTMALLLGLDKGRFDVK
jgi:nitrous oxide reductase accessory protein NosL